MRCAGWLLMPILRGVRGEGAKGWEIREDSAQFNGGCSRPTPSGSTCYSFNYNRFAKTPQISPRTRPALVPLDTSSTIAPLVWTQGSCNLTVQCL